MKIKEWFVMQQELDQYIETEHGLQKENLIDQKILALLVELGELANETRCFKFWSKKPSSDREVILEEYVDGVHFILSIGLEFGFAEKEFSLVPMEGNENLVQCFIKIFHLVDVLRQSPTEKHYEELLRQYFGLGFSLGFSIEEVQTAYKEKNEENYHRQDKGY